MPKNSGTSIQQFNLSPLAKAGVLIKQFTDQTESEKDHDVHAPHIDKHYLLLIGLAGDFHLMLDFRKVKLSMPAILLICPGQVHHIIKAEQPRGWAISFDPSLIEEDDQQLLEQNFSAPYILSLADSLQQQLVTLAALMQELQDGIQNIFNGKALHELLRAMLNLITGRISITDSGSKSKENRGFVIEQSFKKLLKQYYKTWKQPLQYAKVLSVSVSHLNDTVKGITGLSVSTHIQQRAILEAKRLLYFTQLSVKEISYEVGYDNPVHFSKIFKKSVAVSPLQFRQQFRD